MTLYCFHPRPAERPSLIACALSRLAYPVDPATPKPLVQILKRLERR